MLPLQYLIIALSLTLIIKWATMLKRQPWLWSLCLLTLVILAENLLRNTIPGPLATLLGAAAAFVVLFLIRFTPFRY